MSYFLLLKNQIKWKVFDLFVYIGVIAGFLGRFFISSVDITPILLAIEREKGYSNQFRMRIP